MSKITKTISSNIKSLMRAPKNLILRALEIPLKPKKIVFMVTDRCNSHCMHCNIWKQKPVDNPLTPEEIEKIFSDKLFENVDYVLCTGGEPTVRDDLEEIFLRIHKALPKATLQLSTNALLPERTIKLANTAMKNNINLDIGVSLDGIGDAHDIIRRTKGNFEKADSLLHELAALRAKHQGKLNVAAGIVVSDLTVDSIYNVREYAKKLNIDFVEAWYNTSSFYGNYNEEDKAKIKEKIIEIVKSQPLSLLQEKWLSWLKGQSIKFPCFAMNTFCVIKCNGDIVPCLSRWDFKAGNARENSPTEVWHSPKAKEIRKSIKKCKGCLNTWSSGWSFESAYYPILFFYLRHPRISLKRLLSKTSNKKS